MGFFFCQCFFGFDILLNTLLIGQARAVSTDGLRPSFFTINAVVYVVQVFLQSLRNLSLVFVGSWHIYWMYYFQIALWLVLWWKPVRVMVILSKMFFAGN